MRFVFGAVVFAFLLAAAGCSRDAYWATGKDMKKEIGTREQVLRQEMTKKVDLLERQQLEARTRASDIHVQILQDQLAGRATDEKLKAEFKEMTVKQGEIGKDISKVRQDLEAVNQVVADLQAEAAAGKAKEGEHSQEEIDKLKRFEELEKQYSVRK
ncbi:MAG: hypothetical protein ABSH20_13345 [Tepidisphaeraceae bacterium]